jgi:hypothetical protein
MPLRERMVPASKKMGATRLVRFSWKQKTAGVMFPKVPSLSS